MQLIFKEEFYQIKSACLTVKAELGLGFLEKVYENALKIELEQLGFAVIQQYPIQVMYKDNIVGDYFVDLFVDDKIIIEIKTAKHITNLHKAQLLNYLRAT